MSNTNSCQSQSNTDRRYNGIKHKPETTFGNVKADVLADKDPEGQAVFWTPHLSFVLAPGRAYGPKGIRFTATFTPSGFERFFQDIERRRLLATDVAELRAVAADVGMDILGPPLSDEEVRQIIAEAEVS